MKKQDTNNLSTSLEQILDQIQDHIYIDLADGTVIPGRYEEIQNLLDKAKLSLQDGDMDTTLQLIGEINLDALEQVDEFDDTIGELVMKLRNIHMYCASTSKSIPSEIVNELQVLNGLLDKYNKISQTCP